MSQVQNIENKKRKYVQKCHSIKDDNGIDIDDIDDNDDDIDDIDISLFSSYSKEHQKPSSSETTPSIHSSKQHKSFIPMSLSQLVETIEEAIVRDSDTPLWKKTRIEQALLYV